jgi:hypothetical protein
MPKVLIALCAESLRDVEGVGPGNEMTFVVGPKRYELPGIAAQSLSPGVRDLRLIDATIDEISLDIEDREHLTSEFISLGAGAVVEVDETSGEVFESVCRALRTRCIGLTIFREAIRSESVIDRFSLHVRTFTDFSLQLQFTASHLCEVVSRTDCLSIAMLREILSSSSLRIEGEDWLYEYMMRQNREFCGVFSRLEFIRFE